eukprot:gene7096-7899_t
MSGKPSLLKVVILGDGAVGKSALMNRFVNNKFDSQSFHTIGVEFLNKDVKVGKGIYTLQIWDTAGQERFKSLRTPFYRGSDICMLVYSVDDAQSFYNLETWKKEFLYYADIKDADHFPFIVVGNKVDLMGRDISRDEAESWCQSNMLPYYETSAKDATNVDLAFVASVERLMKLEQQLDREMNRSSGFNSVNLKRDGNAPQPDGGRRSGCC